MVQLGNPPANPLVPTTTLPDLLCHTITDKELDLLTDRGATVLGGVCTTAFGVAASSAVNALPAINAIISNNFQTVTQADFFNFVMFAVATPTFLVTLAISGSHFIKKGNDAKRIRARPKMPMSMAP